MEDTTMADLLRVDSMSDAELRAKFFELGFLLTSTLNRMLLVKMLKLVLSEKIKMSNSTADASQLLARPNDTEMDDLEVSDAELRAGLVEHGFIVRWNASPTRKLLVEMLKLVLSEKRKTRDSVYFTGDPRSFTLLSDAATVDYDLWEVDLMSVPELRATLVELGFPVVMSIAAPTRKLLVKLVKLVLSEKGKARNSMHSIEDIRSFADTSRDSDTEIVDLEVDFLSDAQLRAKLAVLGYRILPVVAAPSKKLLMKMLKLVLSEKRKTKRSVSFKRGPNLLARLNDIEMTNLEVDSMSDAELRNKLAEHGYTVLSISDLNRKMLVKMLKLVLSEKKTTRSDNDMTNLEVDLMSDAELRNKLAEHGYTVLSISDLNRKMLVKMLKLKLSEQRKTTSHTATNFDIWEVDLLSEAELRTKLEEHGYRVFSTADLNKKMLVELLKLVLSEKRKARIAVSSADPVDNMSDSELQAKLFELGLVMPITSSQRALFVRMLKNILRKGNPRSNMFIQVKRTTPFYVSSDDESDLESMIE